MCEAGRIRHHLKHNLWRKDSTILFVGFQVPGTLGSNLLNGAKQVKLFGEEVEVRAKILNLRGLSGHADKEKLTEWITHFEEKPKKVFVVHGDDEVAESFVNHLKELKFEAYAPYSGDGFDLLTGERVLTGNRALVEKAKVRAKNSVFARLLAAGERLLTVIRKCEGMANKDLARFADQINALSDKWEK